MLPRNHQIWGHLAAILSILIWGATFISTKVLLEDFSPTEILFFRFVIAFVFLFLLAPKPTQLGPVRQEIKYILAGATGVVCYFLFQNIGLQYTLASNAGILVSVAPMFTAIVALLFGKKQALNRFFLLGFILAITGIAFISFNGQFLLKLNPLGDIMMLLGALAWAFYCNLMAIENTKALSLLRSTRKVFFYGLILMVPIMILTEGSLDPSRFSDSTSLFNLVFLGIGASAVAFLSWNFAVGALGSVKAATYLYLVPIVTIAFSMLLLDERLTPVATVGTALILIGLVLSEQKSRVKPPTVK